MIQNRHGDTKPGSRLANQRVRGQPHPLQPQMRQGMRRHDLDPLDHTQPGRFGGQQKGRQPPCPFGFTRAGKDHIDIRDPAIRDIGLLALQNPAIGLAPRGGGRSGHIRSRSRFGQRKARNRRAGPRAFQPAALRCCAEQGHGPHPQPLHCKGEIRQPVMPGQRLADQAQAANVQHLTARMPQPAARAQIAHQSPAGRVHIAVIDRQRRPGPFVQRRRQLAVTILEKRPVQKASVHLLLCPNTQMAQVSRLETPVVPS